MTAEAFSELSKRTVMYFRVSTMYLLPVRHEQAGLEPESVHNIYMHIQPLNDMIGELVHGVFVSLPINEE